MLKQLITWLVCFGLSFVVQGLGWAEQGKAFMWMHMGAGVLLAVIVAILFAMTLRESFTILVGSVLMTALMGVIVLLFPIGLAWVGSKLFAVDFYVVYQIMSLGACFIPNKNDKQNK